MAILKNKTQGNFTQISNTIFHDRDLSMKDRGVFCTLCSLPDGWEFSVDGLTHFCSDGKDSISKSINRLESLGYIERTKTRDANGKFVSLIEVFAEKRTVQDSPSRKTRHGESATDNPSRDDRNGSSVTDNPSQYNNINNNKEINNEYANSISLSAPQTKEGEIEKYKSLIAKNIDFENLLKDAKAKPGDTAGMLYNIYDTLCDMVCYPRQTVTIKTVDYPWSLVKSRFLKLTKENIVSILDRLAHRDYAITNIPAFLISTLFTESQTGSISSQARTGSDNQDHLEDRTTFSNKINPQLRTTQTAKYDKNQYMQRTYTDEQMSALERKKLGLIKYE